MTSHDYKVIPLVTETLGEILDKISNLDSRDADVNVLMHTCLRTVIRRLSSLHVFTNSQTRIYNFFFTNFCLFLFPSSQKVFLRSK